MTDEIKYECICSGWVEHIKQHEKYDCKPYVNADGELQGCHTETENPIKYCPWCGRDLSQPQYSIQPDGPKSVGLLHSLD